jgi:hypothetical protein
MKQPRRILIALLILIAIPLLVLGVDWMQRQAVSSQPESLEPGSIPIYVDGKLAHAFLPDDLSQLEQVSFVDAEEGKTQEGWLLSDVILLYIPAGDLSPEMQVVVSSSSQEKAVQLTWAEIQDEANMVMFDLAGRGTLKLVSLLPRLDVRDEWVQDVDRIEVSEP